MKYDFKAIMCRAWQIKKKNKRNLFSLSLKMSWFEAKNKMKEMILNKMLHEYCKEKKPLRYSEKMTTLGMLRSLHKSGIEYPTECKKIIAVLYSYMLL